MGGRGVSWAVCEADCGSQDLQLELQLFFFPPGCPHTLLTSPLQPHRCILFHLQQGKEATPEPDVPQEGWKRGPSTPPGSSRSQPLHHRQLGMKPSPTSQPQPFQHQLGRGAFPRCPALFSWGQGCVCPPCGSQAGLSIAGMPDRF